MKFGILGNMKSYHEVLFDEFCERVQKSMANKGPESPDEIPWDVDKVELLLYFAMIGRKPVGVNRNFMMLFIHDRFSRYINREVYSKPIWDHLDSMYDMAALHESEILPFPSDEVDFELPEYLDSLVMEKFGVALTHAQVDDSSQSKNDTSLKSSRKMSTSKLKTNLAPLINKTKEMPYIKPSNTSTPIPPKSGKTTHNLKSDEKPVIAEIVSAKNRPELPVPAKISKNKRSSSPFSSKSSRSETAPSREESPDIPVVRKPKPERSGSPATVKKAVVKSEPPSTPVVGKKAGKEQSNSSSKHVKSEVPDSNVKKVKHERDSVSKKSKLSTNETPGNKKSGNTSNGTKKAKSEPESSSRRSSDSSSNKQPKTDVRNLQNTTKGTKVDDDDSSTVTASRKSASVAKSEPVDSIKKRKRQKVEDSPKKMVTTSQTKRRRT